MAAIEFTSSKEASAISKLLLGVLGGGLTIILVTDPAYVSLWVAILSLAWIAMLPFAYEYAQGKRLDPFKPIFWVAPLFFFAYGAHAGLRLLNGDFSFSGNYTASVHPSVIMLEVLILANVGLVCICAGYYWKRPQSLVRSLPAFNSEWSSRRAWIVIGSLMAIGLVGYFFLLPEIGSGPRTHLAKGTSKYAFIAVNLLNTASVLIVADNLISRKPGNQEGGFLINSLLRTVISLSIIVFNVLILWTLSGRGRAFGILIVSLFLIHYLYHQFSILVGMLSYAIIKVVPAWGIGVVTTLIALDFDSLFIELTNPYLFRATQYTAFNNIVILLAGIPETVRYQYGATFVSALFALMPIQPVPETHTVFNRAFLPAWGTDAGVPITMLGELYLNFWIPGVVIGLFVVGVSMRMTYDLLVRDDSNPAALVLFAVISNDFLLMGNFSNSAPAFGMTTIPMVIALYYISIRYSDFVPTKYI